MLPFPMSPAPLFCTKPSRSQSWSRELDLPISRMGKGGVQAATRGPDCPGKGGVQAATQGPDCPGKGGVQAATRGPDCPSHSYNSVSKCDRHEQHLTTSKSTCLRAPQRGCKD